MSTGSDTMTVEAVFNPNDVEGLRFEQDRVCLIFQGGREICNPLTLYPTLKRADREQRDRWKMIGPKKGFTWEELDLDLSIDQLICGRKEAIPRPPDWSLLEQLQKRLAEEGEE